MQAGSPEGLRVSQVLSLFRPLGRIVEHGTPERAHNLSVPTDANAGARAGVGAGLAALSHALPCRPRTADDLVGTRARHQRHLLATGWRVDGPESGMPRICRSPFSGLARRVASGGQDVASLLS